MRVHGAPQFNETVGRWKHGDEMMPRKALLLPVQRTDVADGCLSCSECVRFTLYWDLCVYKLAISFVTFAFFIWRGNISSYALGEPCSAEHKGCIRSEFICYPIRSRSSTAHQQLLHRRAACRCWEHHKFAIGVALCWPIPILQLGTSLSSCKSSACPTAGHKRETLGDLGLRVVLGTTQTIHSCGNEGEDVVQDYQIIIKGIFIVCLCSRVSALVPGEATLPSRVGGCSMCFLSRAMRGNVNLVLCWMRILDFDTFLMGHTCLPVLYALRSVHVYSAFSPFLLAVIDHI